VNLNVRINGSGSMIGTISPRFGERVRESDSRNLWRIAMELYIMIESNPTELQEGSSGPASHLRGVSAE
jgi:hypothetical protein